MISLLRKVIIVSGVGNSGKTSSIKMAMQKLAVFDNTGRADKLIATNAFSKGRFFASGFATGGDAEYVIKQNIDFFESVRLELDIIVMACKSYGVTTELAKEFAHTAKAEEIFIETEISNNHEIAADKISNQIARHFQ